MSVWSRIRRLARTATEDVLRRGERRAASRRRSPVAEPARGQAAVDAGHAPQRRVDAVFYNVAEHGLPQMHYSPRDDGHPDPGEVVWAWVPYEDDPSQGKDRPVLILARLDRGRLLGAQMTSKDRADRGVVTDQHGRVWVDVGSGAWDRQGRDSDVRIDSLLSLEPSSIRREGAALDVERFEIVTNALHTIHD